MVAPGGSSHRALETLTTARTNGTGHAVTTRAPKRARHSGGGFGASESRGAGGGGRAAAAVDADAAAVGEGVGVPDLDERDAIQNIDREDLECDANDLPVFGPLRLEECTADEFEARLDLTARDAQRDTLAALREGVRASRRVALAQLPTGTGKSNLGVFVSLLARDEHLLDLKEYLARRGGDAVDEDEKRELERVQRMCRTSAAVCCCTVALQQQMYDSFPDKSFVIVVFGRWRYGCIKKLREMLETKIPNGTPQHAFLKEVEGSDYMKAIKQDRSPYDQYLDHARTFLRELGTAAPFREADATDWWYQLNDCKCAMESQPTDPPVCAHSALMFFARLADIRVINFGVLALYLKFERFWLLGRALIIDEAHNLRDALSALYPCEEPIRAVDMEECNETFGSSQLFRRTGKPDMTQDIARCMLLNKITCDTSRWLNTYFPVEKRVHEQLRKIALNEDRLLACAGRFSEHVEGIMKPRAEEISRAPQPFKLMWELAVAQFPSNVAAAVEEEPHEEEGKEKAATDEGGSCIVEDEESSSSSSSDPFPVPPRTYVKCLPTETRTSSSSRYPSSKSVVDACVRNYESFLVERYIPSEFGLRAEKISDDMSLAAYLKLVRKALVSAKSLQTLQPAFKGIDWLDSSSQLLVPHVDETDMKGCVEFTSTRQGISIALYQKLWRVVIARNLTCLLMSATMCTPTNSFDVFERSLALRVGGVQPLVLRICMPPTFLRLAIARDVRDKAYVHGSGGDKLEAYNKNLIDMVCGYVRCNDRKITIVAQLAKERLAWMRGLLETMLPDRKHVMFSAFSVAMSKIRSGEDALYANCVLYCSKGGIEGLDLPGKVGLVIITQPLRMPYNPEEQYAIFAQKHVRLSADAVLANYGLKEFQHTMQAAGRIQRRESDAGLVLFCGIAASNATIMDDLARIYKTQPLLLDYVKHSEKIRRLCCPE